MGALHEAHINLINRSAELCDVNVCSIFVNPTQFNDPADYDKVKEEDTIDIIGLTTFSPGIPLPDRT